MPPAAQRVIADASRPQTVSLNDYLEGFSRIVTPVWVFDTDEGRVRWANPAAMELWRAKTLDELVARNMADEMSPTVATRLKQYQQDFHQGSWFTEVWTLYPNGEPVTLHCTFSGIQLDDGSMGMFCQAVEESQDTPETLRSVQALLHTTVMISLYDLGGARVYQNPAAREVLGEQAVELINRFADATDYNVLRLMLERDGTASFVSRVNTATGPRWHEINARKSRDAVTGTPAILITEVDVSELKETERRAQYLAVHDMLTGLPNRAFMQREFSERLLLAGSEGRAVGFLFIDLDNFKTINDTLGHAVGDKLLIEVARRLTANTRSGDMVTRLGGDEFIVFINEASERFEVQSQAERIREVLSEPVKLAEYELRTTPSIGISLFPEDGEDMEALMKHADLAMYQAKDLGRNQHCFFTSDMRDRAQTRLELESSLRSAVDHGEFELYYQPQVCFKTGRVRGAEALLRWHHPTRGTLAPGAFMSVAEETGLIEQIGEWIFADAAAQQVKWREQGHDLSVSINLSPRQFNSEELIPMIKRIAATQGCDPTSLDLEITESMLMGDSDKIVHALQTLSHMGFSIAIDDFGTGYSNLAYLQRYPISSLKIDRSFIRDLGETSAITELIIAMCKLLNVKIIAEGVEEAHQLAWLAEKGCHQYQGYFFSPPVREGDFIALLTSAENAGAPVFDLDAVARRQIAG